MRWRCQHSMRLKIDYVVERCLKTRLAATICAMYTVGERLPREVRASVLVRLCKRRAGRDERCTARPRPLALGCKTARYCTNQERLPGLSTTYEERARCRPRHHQPVGEMGRTFCFQQVLWRLQSHIQAVIGSITRHPIFLHLPSR